MIVAEVELSGRSEHAVADVTVGRSGRNVKVAWQGCARKANYNLVADLEVACATDDSANVFTAVGCLAALWRNANLTPANGFAVGLLFGRELENLADNYGAGYLECVTTLFF